MADANVEPETPPNPPINRELNAVVDKVKGSIMTCLTSEPLIFDGDVDLNEVEHGFIPFEGDNIKVIVTAEEPAKVLAIEPDVELKSHTGKITHLTKSFAIVDDDIIFFITDEATDFKKNDFVECVVIEGEYSCGKSKYDYRVESMNKMAEVSVDVMRLFKGPTLETVEEVNSDSDTETADDEPNMEFAAMKGKEPNEEWYDLPYGLYEILRSENLHRIKMKLKQFVPPELNYKTYRKRFHAHVFLEEVEMQLSFEKYKANEISIEPENKRFSIMCSKITELRPPIAVGRFIIHLKFFFFEKKVENLQFHCISFHLISFCAPR